MTADAPITVEGKAAQRIGRMISKHLDAAGMHTERFWSAVGGKVLAHQGFISSVFRDVKADPHHIGDRDPIVLRQQQNSNREDDMTWWLETAQYHKRAYEEAVDMIDRLTARAAAERESDVDERGADEDDRRVSRERADEKALTEAPRAS